MAKFIKPEDFGGNIPGRGRKPSELAIKVVKELSGCPEGQGAELTASEFVGKTAKDRARIRGSITTASKSLGWAGVSVNWTDQNTPFVLRTAG